MNLFHISKFVKMAGLPASPPFANPMANAVLELNTPLVPAGLVDASIVGQESMRVHRAYLCRSITDHAYVTTAELGEAEIRKASAIAQAAPAAVAPEWFTAGFNAVVSVCLPVSLSLLHTHVTIHPPF